MEPGGAQRHAFISVDGLGRPKPQDRKLIRSRCMKGRNLRIGVHPVPTESDVGHSGKPPHETSQNSQPTSRLLRHATDRRIPRDGSGNQEAIVYLPSPSSANISPIVFAGKMDDYSRSLIFNCMMSTHLPHQDTRR
jgi:hypothetical protein